MDITSTALFTDTRRLASGNYALLAGAVVVGIVSLYEVDRYIGPDFDEGPCCSICDGLGHGYPGGPPCPLEERGAAEIDAEDRYDAQRGVVPFDVAMAAAG